MLSKFPRILFWLMLAGAATFGQTSFQGLSPGVSTRSDVARVLGPPVRTISVTHFEYNAPAGIGMVEVRYSESSSLVEQVDVHFLKPISRSALIAKFNLPQQASAQTVTEDGKRVEYFGDRALLALTYASSDTSSGASQIAYYSRDFFQNAVARITNRPGTPSTSKPSEVDSPNNSSSGRAPVNLPPEMFPPGTHSASVDRTGRTLSSDGNSAESASTKRTTTTTRSEPSSNGSSSMTVSRRADGAFVIQPSTKPTEVEDSDVGPVETEMSLSVAELRKLVGSYRFTQTSIPGLRLASIGLLSGKLRLTMGSASHALTPLVGNDFVVGETGDVLSFKAADKSGVKVYFLISDDKIDRLYILETLRQPKRFSIAVPQP